MLSPIPSNSVIFLVHLPPPRFPRRHDHFQSIQGLFDLRPITWCIKLQRQLTVQLQIYPLICCKLTQMIKLLKVQPDSKLVWVIDRDFCQQNQGLKLYFLDLITVLLAIYQCLLKSQKWIRRSSPSIHYVLIQKRLLDYSIFIPSKLGLPLSLIKVIIKRVKWLCSSHWPWLREYEMLLLHRGIMIGLLFPFHLVNFGLVQN